jgi:hypothetical protein
VFSVLSFFRLPSIAIARTAIPMNEFSPQQVATLERLIAKEFTLVAFPLYANVVGVRKGTCAALLDPIPNGGFRVFGEPCVLLEGNLTVRITEKGKSWFVWKKQRLEATEERLAELESFVAALKFLLEPHE